MLIREKTEAMEKHYLSPYAAQSVNSIGRERYEEPCDIRTCYQRDRDRILHCKAFRRLKHKTQVFLSPHGDHYRTRLTHTLEVSQSARTIAKALRLNEELVEAIALGHDLGHTPFGHAGERALTRASGIEFIHSDQSVRVVECLEKDGTGLNLCYEVRDGIRNHQTLGMPMTLEGKVVRMSDKIAYIHHDMDDAIRGGILKEENIPREIKQVLGNSLNARLNTLIHDIVENSQEQADIKMSPDVLDAMMKLRKFMFHEVYTNPIVKAEEQKAEDLIISLYEYYSKHIELLPQDRLLALEGGCDEVVVVCDYIASMSDQFAISTFHDLFIPKSWNV
ncbi:MAG: deoxyguanosinetriphosphate triphosphohydrolase [Lachnospiraceae bacterium]